MFPRQVRQVVADSLVLSSFWSFIAPSRWIFAVSLNSKFNGTVERYDHRFFRAGCSGLGIRPR